MTNWDADWLGANIKKGTPVEFVENEMTARR
jgi:lipoprotein-anchoring transpeptidase ErfK/SrfK